jgi:hypothetical protein
MPSCRARDGVPSKGVSSAAGGLGSWHLRRAERLHGDEMRAYFVATLRLALAGPFSTRPNLSKREP